MQPRYILDHLRGASIRDYQIRNQTADKGNTCGINNNDVAKAQGTRARKDWAVVKATCCCKPPQVTSCDRLPSLPYSENKTAEY